MILHQLWRGKVSERIRVQFVIIFLTLLFLVEVVKSFQFFWWLLRSFREKVDYLFRNGWIELICNNLKLKCPAITKSKWVSSMLEPIHFIMCRVKQILCVWWEQSKRKKKSEKNICSGSAYKKKNLMISISSLKKLWILLSIPMILNWLSMRFDAVIYLLRYLIFENWQLNFLSTSFIILSILSYITFSSKLIINTGAYIALHTFLFEPWKW